jgi:hypothetical protein
MLRLAQTFWPFQIFNWTSNRKVVRIDLLDNMPAALTKAQRAAKLRKERSPLEIRNDYDIRNEMRRSQLSQSMVQLSSTIGSLSSSSSSAVHNVNNRINDSDEESAFSEEGLQPSPTQSPVKKRQNIPRKQPP